MDYPLSVFLDTNVFISEKFNFSQQGTLNLLVKFVQEGKVKVFLSNIVIREAEKHFIQSIFEIRTLFNKALKEASKKISNNIADELISPKPFLPESDEEITSFAHNSLMNFLSETDATVLNSSGVNIETVINAYFNGEFPFEDKKKYEFPDAFIISKLKLQFSNDNPVHVISSDNGFRSALIQCDGINVYSSLKELFDILSRQSQLYNKITEYISNSDTHSILLSRIKDKIESDEIVVDGCDYDRKGFCEGFDYDDSYLIGICNIGYCLDSVDEIGDKEIHATLKCTADISVECSYTDYENSIWDSEEKEYIYTIDILVVESHHPEFECEVVFSLEEVEEEIIFEVESIDFNLELDQHTRTNRVFIDSEDPKMDFEAEQMDTIEEYYKH